MQELVSVGGELWIQNNDLLTDLTPLENLTSIGSNLYVINNELLPSLIGLDNIAPNSIINLEIHNNPLLSECDVQSICNYLVSPNGTIEIGNNATGCNSVAEIEYDCENNCLPEGIEFETQAEIDNFQTNHPGCTEIEGNVTIGKFQNSSNITNVDGLSVLTAIGGYLDIRLNDYLTSLSGLSNLNLVGGLLSVYNNDALTNLSGFDQITYAGGKVYIAYNDALTSLTGLENLIEIGGDFVIRENTLLPNLTGIQNLGTIGGALEIRVNEILVNIIGLSGLTSIGDYLWIVGNDELTSLEGLEGLTALSSYLDISYNPALTDLSGLNNLTSIGGHMLIRDNDDLVNPTGLENLNSIGGYMEMRNNDVLENLTALEGLTTIGAEFRIWDNDVLTSLSGLDNIEANSISDLYINDNASLSICDIESVCNYLAAPNGAIYINNNATGCADQEELEDACFSGISELNTQNNFTISPNPVASAAQVRYTILEKGFTICELFEISGVRIKSMINEENIPGTYEMKIDLSEIPKGFYFCILNTGHGIQSKKLIIQ